MCVYVSVCVRVEGEFVSEWVSRDWNIPRNDLFYNLFSEKVLERAAAA